MRSPKPDYGSPYISSAAERPGRNEALGANGFQFKGGYFYIETVRKASPFRENSLAVGFAT
jgi:hypothetical protein